MIAGSLNRLNRKGRIAAGESGVRLETWTQSVFGAFARAVEKMRQKLSNEERAELQKSLRQLKEHIQALEKQQAEAETQANDIMFQLPAIPSGWQFLVDIIPTQLVAERLSRLSGVDCDTFRLCAFVVEDEGGLLPKARSAEVDSRQLRVKRKRTKT